MHLCLAGVAPDRCVGEGRAVDCWKTEFWHTCVCIHSISGSGMFVSTDIKIILDLTQNYKSSGTKWLAGSKDLEDDVAVNSSKFARSFELLCAQNRECTVLGAWTW